MAFEMDCFGCRIPSRFVRAWGELCLLEQSVMLDPLARAGLGRLDSFIAEYHCRHTVYKPSAGGRGQVIDPDNTRPPTPELERHAGWEECLCRQSTEEKVRVCARAALVDLSFYGGLEQTVEAVTEVERLEMLLYLKKALTFWPGHDDHPYRVLIQWKLGEIATRMARMEQNDRYAKEREEDEKKEKNEDKKGARSLNDMLSQLGVVESGSDETMQWE